MTLSVYIFRHGETAWNAEKRMQGHTDIPLNQLGRAQADGLAGRLLPLRLQAIVSSDLARARETGEIVAGRLGIPHLVDGRFREVSLGAAEGLVVDEVVARFGDHAWGRFKSVEAVDLDFSFARGETKRAGLDRAIAALNDLLACGSYERLGVATHGGIMRAVVHAIVSRTEAISVKNCAVHLIRGERRDPVADWHYVPL